MPRPRSGSGPIVLITRVWPRPHRPSVGAFVRDRARGVDGMVVVRPRRRSLPWLLVYLQLLIDALAVKRPIRAVEAHMLVPTGLVGLFVARVRGVPVGIYVHGGDVRNWRTAPAPIRWIMRLAARGADRVWTNSEDTATHLRELGADPTVIPPGIDLGRFRPTPRPAHRRVLFLGGRTPGKGYDIALDLADTLVGPQLRDLDPAVVPGLIADHDVILVPSAAEAFGLVAVEAIASGRWVVASDVGGLRDIILDGVNGTLVRDGDFARALAEVPDYDPFVIAPTVARFGLDRWQAAMAAEWDALARRAATK